MMRRVFGLACWLLCCVCAAMALAWLPVAILLGNARAWRMIVAFDRVGNAALGGSDRETISSRANRARAGQRRWGCVLCKVLDWLSPGHCAASAGV